MLLFYFILSLHAATPTPPVLQITAQARECVALLTDSGSFRRSVVSGLSQIAVGDPIWGLLGHSSEWEFLLKDAGIEAAAARHLRSQLISGLEKLPTRGPLGNLRGRMIVNGIYQKDHDYFLCLLKNGCHMRKPDFATSNYVSTMHAVRVAPLGQPLQSGDPAAPVLPGVLVFEAPQNEADWLHDIFQALLYYADNKLLEEWATACVRLAAAGLPPDRLAQKYLRLEQVPPVLDEGFYRVFLNGRLWQASLQAFLRTGRLSSPLAIAANQRATRVLRRRATLIWIFVTKVGLKTESIYLKI